MAKHIIFQVFDLVVRHGEWLVAIAVKLLYSLVVLDKRQVRSCSPEPRQNHFCGLVFRRQYQGFPRGY